MIDEYTNVFSRNAFAVYDSWYSTSLLTKNHTVSIAKAASTEAANDQDELPAAEISDAETEADGVTAEKENEESLGISEQAEEQVPLEPALAKKKRKKKRKDDLEQEVENIPEEMSVPSKTAEEGKSSNKSKRQKCSLSNIQIEILYKVIANLKVRIWSLIPTADLVGGCGTMPFKISFHSKLKHTLF